MLLARIFTLYPDFFPGPLGKGLYGKAMEKKIWDMETVNIRDYATDKHKTVDDTLYGGGFGMLIKPDVLAKALDENLKGDDKIYYLSPKGKLFDQKLAKELSKEKKINLIFDLYFFIPINIFVISYTFFIFCLRSINNIIQWTKQSKMAQNSRK